MTPITKEESVRTSSELWRSILQRKGEPLARTMFWGVKHSLIGSSMPRQTKRGLLEGYLQVEREVFGSIQEVPRELELLGESLPSSAGSGFEMPTVSSPPAIGKPSTS